MEDLARSILKEQSVMKIVLNGGKHELDDATIPFQIGFDKSIVDSKPTHILVIDVATDPFTENNGERCSYSLYSKRTLFELEPIQYLQLNKPGIHYLIFILLKEVDKYCREFFLKKSRVRYDQELYFSSIEENKLPYQLCYAEVVVDVPEQLFAPEPKTKFQKAIHRWVNGWYELEPIDECEYKKRRIPAFTIKPILWLLVLIPRIICSIFLAVIIPVPRLLFFLAGTQPVYFFPNYRKLLIDFLFLYPREGYKRVFDLDNWTGYLGKISEDDAYDYKTLAIGKKRIHIPVTFFGLIYYFFMFLLYGWAVYAFWAKLYPHIVLSFFATVGLFFLSLIIAHSMIVTISTAKKGEEWEQKWRLNYSYGEAKKETERGKNVAGWITSILTIIAILSFLITQVPWTTVGKATIHVSKSIFPFIVGILASGLLIRSLYLAYKCLLPLLKKVIAKIPKTKKVKLPSIKTVQEKREQKRKQWLIESFDINKLPEKVDVKFMPKPSSVIHRFTVAFWYVKAKVCRPYAR